MPGYFGGVSPVRQNQRAKLIGVAAVVAALVLLVLGLVLFVKASPGGSAPVASAPVQDTSIEMVEVLVPLQTVEAGAALEPSMFRKEARPRIGISKQIVRDFEEIKGFYARSLIAADQPLHSDYITQIRPTNAITAKIPEGYRAVTINVDARTSVEGWVKPGAKVDVSWAYRVSGKEAVAVIVKNAQVLSTERSTDTDQAARQGAPVPNTVTLLVSSKDAQKIQLAQTSGTLTLSLRGDGDSGRDEVLGAITIEDLTGTREQPGQSQPPAGGTVRIRNADGKFEEYVLRNGKLEPLAK